MVFHPEYLCASTHIEKQIYTSWFDLYHVSKFSISIKCLKVLWYLIHNVVILDISEAKVFVFLVRSA